MTALTIALSLGGPAIALHPSDGCANFVGTVVPDAIRDLLPHFMTVINHDGESILTHVPKPREVKRSTWLPVLCRALKARNELAKATMD